MMQILRHHALATALYLFLVPAFVQYGQHVRHDSEWNDLCRQAGILTTSRDCQQHYRHGVSLHARL